MKVETSNNDCDGIFYVLIWVFQSVVMTIFNKLVLSSWKFHYPFFLTCWHMILFCVLTRVLAISKSNLMPSLKDNKLSLCEYMKKILPFSLAAATQLVCSNSAYSYLSLALIQILKALSPVTLLILQYIIGKETPSLTKFGIVSLISCGVGICTIGEINFNLIGFVLQCSAILSDNLRAILMEALLFNNKIDSITMIYYIAPPCSILIGIGFVIFELPTFPFEILTPSLFCILLLNGILAFSLNISNVKAVSSSSALFLSLFSPIRDGIVILMSVIVFGSPLLPIQIFGFFVCLFGLYLYNQYKQNPQMFQVSSLSEIIRRILKQVSFQSSQNNEIEKEISTSTLSTPYDVTMDNSKKIIEV